MANPFHKPPATPDVGEILQKSFWKEKNTKHWSFFCPLCRVNRRVAYHPRPTPKHYFQIALTTVVFMLATWPWFGWKGAVAFVPFWTVFEVFYRTRMRADLSCPQCGFDPYLYLVDIKRAREEIETHWRKKFAEKGVPFPEKESPAAQAGAGTGPRMGSQSVMGEDSDSP